MNSAQYYDMIRELREINRKLDVLVTRSAPEVYVYPSYTQPPSPQQYGTLKTPPHAYGPIGTEQELPFKENES